MFALSRFGTRYISSTQVSYAPSISNRLTYSTKDNIKQRCANYDDYDNQVKDFLDKYVMHKKETIRLQPNNYNNCNNYGSMHTEKDSIYLWFENEKKVDKLKDRITSTLLVGNTIVFYNLIDQMTSMPL